MKKQILNLFMLVLLFMSSCNLLKEDLEKRYFDFEIDGVAYCFVEDGVEVVPKTNPSNYSKEVIIPSEVMYEGITYDVVGIGQFAFNGSNVTSVILPMTIKYLSDDCFQDCKNLKSLQLPANLSYIGYGVFYNSGIESITIPASVTYIGSDNICCCPQLKYLAIESTQSPLITDDDYGWYYGDDDRASKKLEEVFIGRNIKGNIISNPNPIDYNECRNLKKVGIGKYVTKFEASFVSILEIRCEPESPPETSGGCSEECLNNSTVYVPESALKSYQQDAYWGQFKNIKTL